MKYRLIDITFLLEKDDWGPWVVQLYEDNSYYLHSKFKMSDIRRSFHYNKYKNIFDNYISRDKQVNTLITAYCFGNKTIFKLINRS